MTQYFHGRRLDEQGNIISKGGFTVAVNVPVLDGVSIHDMVDVEVGIALCSNKDNYNRSLGRLIANGRLNLCKMEVISKTDNTIVLFSELDKASFIFEKKKNKIHFTLVTIH